MDSFERPMEDNEVQPVPGEPVISYPPKYQPESRNANIWLRSLSSLAIYLALGYYIFKRWEVLLLITAVVVIHELGHFIAMKAFRYRDLGIFFIPLLGAYVSGSKREVSQRESAIILLAGPIPGILIGVVFYVLGERNIYLSIGDTSYYTISMFFVILNLFNLLPVYPLDGGQLLNRVFLNEDNWLSKIFIFLSIALLTWFAWKSHFPVLYIFPAMMIIRMFSDNRVSRLEKRIEEEGFNTDLEYEDLPDEEYWKIRDIVIQEQPSLADLPGGPPYQYSGKEEKIMTIIQGLLHRNLLQDVSIAGKILIMLIWVAAIASPWLADMDMSFLKRFY
jgi:stage IV sporulation protein FB